MRPICTHCEREMILGKPIIVIEFYQHGPYRLWYADPFTCPTCAHVIVTRFADRPYAEHYQPGFDAQVLDALMGGNSVKSFENDERRAAYYDANPAPAD